MYKALSPSAIGVRPSNLGEVIPAARTEGFKGGELAVPQLAIAKRAHCAIIDQNKG